jgi:hypothetical protein
LIPGWSFSQFFQEFFDLLLMGIFADHWDNNSSWVFNVS